MRELYPLKAIVVDDEERIIRNVTKRIILVDTATEVVDVAFNGEEALASIRKHRPHIVFTDIKMPRMDGLELAKEIKRQFPNIYVVIISGFSQFDYAQQAIKHGVFNYLLKPIDKEKIADVITEIRKNILASQSSQTQRDIIIPGTSRELSLNHPLYSVYLLCVNNLCHDPMDEEILKYYERILKQVDWRRIFKRLGYEDWTMVDDYYVNEKVIIIGHHQQCCPEEIGRGIRRKVEKALDYIPVSICTHNSAIPREELWMYTQRMRHLLHQKLIPTKVNYFLLERDEEAVETELRYSIKSRINQNLKKAIKAKNLKMIKEEIKGIVEYMGKTAMSQKHYEKALISMLGHMELYLEGFDNTEADMFRIKLFRTLHFASEHNDVYEAMLDCISNYFTKSVDKVQNVQHEILDFVDQNFVHIERVEEVAERFNYNYTYLSRLFKKMTGVTMNKYITNKRIELAKEVMSGQPEMSLGEVGNLVGYKDPHYFSRTFKSVTGYSPTEFRQQN